MKIHPQVTHANGIVTVLITPQFIGDPTDQDDRDRITAYGDPLINMGGSFSDGAPTPFTFATAAPEVWAKLTTEMQGKAVRFMTQLPLAVAGQPAPVAGPLDIITSDPVKAATTYVTALQARIATAMGALRLKTPAKLATLPDTTV